MPKARFADRGPKKKSIKARAVLSSKRKLSRFGKKGKKGLRGAAALYVSRSRAITRLQISLKDFRRLCILKGIYPREPSNRRSGDTQVRGGAAGTRRGCCRWRRARLTRACHPSPRPQTYFHIKDVMYLQHEPLLAKFREFKVRGRLAAPLRVVFSRARELALANAPPMMRHLCVILRLSAPPPRAAGLNS